MSCETVRTMRRESVDLVTDDEATILVTDPVDGELILLIQRADQLHSGDAKQKREGFQLLCNNRLLVHIVFLTFCTVILKLGLEKQVYSSIHYYVVVEAFYN